MLSKEKHPESNGTAENGFLLQNRNTKTKPNGELLRLTFQTWMAESEGESHVSMFTSAGGLTTGESCFRLSLFATCRLPRVRFYQQKRRLWLFGARRLQLDALCAPRSTQEEVPYLVSSNSTCIACFSVNYRTLALCCCCVAAFNTSNVRAGRKKVNHLLMTLRLDQARVLSFLAAGNIYYLTVACAARWLHETWHQHGNVWVCLYVCGRRRERERQAHSHGWVHTFYIWPALRRGPCYR